MKFAIFGEKTFVVLAKEMCCNPHDLSCRIDLYKVNTAILPYFAGGAKLLGRARGQTIKCKWWLIEFQLPAMHLVTVAMATKSKRFKRYLCIQQETRRFAADGDSGSVIFEITKENNHILLKGLELLFGLLEHQYALFQNGDRPRRSGESSMITRHQGPPSS